MPKVSRVTHKRFVVTNLDEAGRRVELRCACARVGLHATAWEDLDGIADLL